MDKKNKFNIYVGLLKDDMRTQLNKSDVINTVANAFHRLGVSGFNVEDVVGYWDGKPEDALKFSFINTFGVGKPQLVSVLAGVKDSLEQESILLEEELTNYSFL